MDFWILGPLEVGADGRRVEIGGAKQRALLGFLLVHANEVVSADRLIDALWGETPPPAALKSLRAYVSRLRRSLDDDRVETRGNGYLLRVEPDELDANRFRRLLEEARNALAQGDPHAASGLLEEALALWRGPALADFAYAEFARSEVARLEDLRLAAHEERIDAELALGRHRQLIPDVEALVAAEPLRERRRGQLMLALYRCDRQTEALQVYQLGRRLLAEELGLEPSESLQRLERQILEHDPALDPPPAPEEISVETKTDRRPLRPALVALFAVLAASAAVAVLVSVAATGSSKNGTDAQRSSVAVLDPDSGRLVETIPAGSAASKVAAGEDAVWVIDADDRTIAKIDANERTVVRTLSTGLRATDLVVDKRGVWVGNGGGFGSFPVSVSRVDPDTGVADAPIHLPGTGTHPYFSDGGFEQGYLATTDDAVWVVNPDGSVSRIDPRTKQLVARVGGLRAISLAASDGVIWALEHSMVAKIDPATNTVSMRIRVPAESLSGIAVGARALWAADPTGGTVWRIEPRRKAVMRTIPLDVGVARVAFGNGAIWATNDVADKVYRIDPQTNQAQVVSRMTAPGSVATGAGGVWVTAAGPPAADAALPPTVCGRVFYGGTGAPRYLIVSDLPLQAPPLEFTRPMVEAIRLVLEQHDFKAGEHTVGYQSCDDSTAQSQGFVVSRCFANAKAYARTPQVVGVIGAINSGCTGVEIPVTNQAPGGPLAMISPANTVTALTRPYLGMKPGELDELYPSGKRNYVRIAAADHLQAVAMVTAAKQVGSKRVFLAWDGDDPGNAAIAADMRKAARKLGVVVAGSASWDPFARRFDLLATKGIAPTRPDAVLLAGAAPPHLTAFVRDLRAGLGPGVALIGSDGFSAFDSLIRIGPAAQGMYVSVYGIPNAELPPPGKRFLTELERTHGVRSTLDSTASYAAQAAEILLDAISRSDGTRASVTRELLRTHVKDGLLGDIRFDEYGDLVEGPLTIYRVAGEQAVVDRVLTVRAPG